MPTVNRSLQETKAKDHKNIKVKSHCFFPADRGAAANVAYAHHNSNRNVFDEWVFSCQGTVEVNNPLAVFAVQRGGCTPLFQKFFQFFKNTHFLFMYGIVIDTKLCCIFPFSFPVKE